METAVFRGCDPFPPEVRQHQRTGLGEGLPRVLRLSGTLARNGKQRSPKSTALKRSAGSMPDSVDDNTSRVGPVENHIRIGPCYRPADPILASKASRIRVVCEQVNHGPEPPLDVVRALRRTSIKVVEDFRKLPQRPTCVTDLHSPCFAQTARTSSSVANSPFAASASEASRSAASSGVSS